jgi:hypothetical protein
MATERRFSTVAAEGFRATCCAAHPSSIATLTLSSAFRTATLARRWLGTAPGCLVSFIRIICEMFALNAK